MKIVKIHGTQIIIEDGQGKQHRRNTSHVKLFVQQEDRHREVDALELEDDNFTINRHHTTTITSPCVANSQPQVPTTNRATPTPGQQVPRRSAR